MLEELELYKTALTFSDTEDIVETKAVCAEILIYGQYPTGYTGNYGKLQET